MTRARDVATQGGLVLISSTTIGSAVSSVVVSNAFSATYDNYKIIIAGGVGSNNTLMRTQLGSDTSGYVWASTYVTSAAGSTPDGTGSGGAAHFWGGYASTNTIAMDLTLQGPNLAKRTTFMSEGVNTISTGGHHRAGGFLDNTNQHTAFTISPQTGTITGGTISLYGYKK